MRNAIHLTNMAGRRARSSEVPGIPIRWTVFPFPERDWENRRAWQTAGGSDQRPQAASSLSGRAPKRKRPAIRRALPTRGPQLPLSENGFNK